MTIDRYYMLECYTPPDWEDSALLDGIRLPDMFESMTRGQRLKRPPPEPVVIEMDGDHNDRMLELDHSSDLVMSRRLEKAVREAGVDNMDVYETIIRHPETGFETKDYVLVNILGLVAAADLAKSNVVGGSRGNLLDTDFDGVEIDPNKAHGLLMFRLAESTNAIVVHESVKDVLLEKGFDMLEFVEPKNWIG